LKVAIVGSRDLQITDFEKYLPKNVTEIISGGARGVDSSARAYAVSKGIPIKEFLPEYHRYGRAAPLKRNDVLLDAADHVLIFWNGHSRGTKYVIEQCQRRNISFEVYYLDRQETE